VSGSPGGPKWRTIVVMMLKLRHCLWIAVALAAALHAPAQSKRVRDIAVGKLLVAPRDALDPRFAQTVILLVQRERQGAVGLIVNRRTPVPISRALADWKAAKDKADPVYMGGPVGLNGILALLRLPAKPPDAEPVFSDIYLCNTRKLLETRLAEGTGSNRFRIYLGYCGWDPGQLEREVDLGVWYIFGGDPGLVFDSNPASLWSRLIARTEQQVAVIEPLRFTADPW
jgi:putative AlgH/UPF0301 family transcriptional regulator